MQTTPLLLDSGFLYALFDQDDRFHKAVNAVAETQAGIAIVPDVVLVEVLFLVRRTGGIPAMARFLEYFDRANFQMEALHRRDIRRARELINKYADARFDFVDTCLIAIAERLDIRRIRTLDRRDFTLVLPAHCDYFELLPTI